MNDGAQDVAEMPRYRSHKEIRALKIQSIEYLILDARLHFEEEGYRPIEVSRQYMVKHQPKAGGYYVVYKDVCESWSPAVAFEDGHTRI